MSWISLFKFLFSQLFHKITCIPKLFCPDKFTGEFSEHIQNNSFEFFVLNFIYVTLTVCHYCEIDHVGWNYVFLGFPCNFHFCDGACSSGFSLLVKCFWYLCVHGVLDCCLVFPVGFFLAHLCFALAQIGDTWLWQDCRWIEEWHGMS